jgi:hypothetical protein
MKHLLLSVLTLVALPSIACAQHSNSGAVPAMYATKAEAEKAATKFNCTGAHQMGDQWMPCTKHGDSKTHAH